MGKTKIHVEIISRNDHLKTSEPELLAYFKIQHQMDEFYIHGSVHGE